jgi:hypothetical protein
MLRPNKPEQCYDIGVLGRASVTMHPGLGVIARVRGRPEQAGRLVIGFTMQSKIAGGLTGCEPISPVSTFAEARVVRSPSGLVVAARFEGRDLANTPELDGNATHEIRLSIGNDRRLVYTVDQQQLTASDPLPTIPVGARVVVFGRGVAAGVEDVRVTDGTQCDNPAAWQPAPQLEVLAGTGDNGGSWDSYQVFAPAFVSTPDVGDHVLYAGCAMGNASNRCVTGVGFGRAVPTLDGKLARDADNPVHFDVSRRNVDVTMVRGDTSANPRGYMAAADVVSAFLGFIQTFTLGKRGTDLELGMTSLHLGAAGQWDDAALCCASAVKRDGQTLLWYAGQRTNDPTWRIGLATSADGVAFQRYAGNPVMREGGPDEIDARGVADPDIVWDATRGLYRMWYTANGFLGSTSIAYAVSTDGITWHKFPANPVVSHGAVGLDSIGSPAVQQDLQGLKMWVQGALNGRVGLRIFALENRGKPSPMAPP